MRIFFRDPVEGRYMWNPDSFTEGDHSITFEVPINGNIIRGRKVVEVPWSNIQYVERELHYEEVEESSDEDLTGA